MQPEANIDVWGRKYRDQTKLVEEISRNLPKGAVLYVKPNPKSKYELSEDLIALVLENKNIIPLSHATKMDHILPEIDLVITVTGTIAIECILGNKPVITLTKTINNEASNCIYVEDLSAQLPQIIKDAESYRFGTVTNQEKIDFINILNKTSYKGLITDPFTDGNCVLKENVVAIVDAFKLVLN